MVCPQIVILYIFTILPTATLSMWIRIYGLFSLLRSKAHPKKGVLNMKLNCIWWWGSNFGDLRNVEFIAITSKSLWVRRDLEVIAINSTLLRSPKLEPHHQIQFSFIFNPPLFFFFFFFFFLTQQNQKKIFSSIKRSCCLFAHELKYKVRI